MIHLMSSKETATMVQYSPGQTVILAAYHAVVSMVSEHKTGVSLKVCLRMADIAQVKRSGVLPRIL